MKSESTPRVYVGTYGAYNNGNLHGAWLNLDDYCDIYGFNEAVNELHAAEIAIYGEIEPMFQDHEGIPDKYICESHLSPAVWDEWVSLDDDDKEVLELFLDNCNQYGTLEQARDAYMGRADSKADWAEEFLSDTGLMDSIPEHLRCYFDFEKYACDVGISDVTFVHHLGGVWVFSNNY